jgi:hypothetical protein
VAPHLNQPSYLTWLLDTLSSRVSFPHYSQLTLFRPRSIVTMPFLTATLFHMQMRLTIPQTVWLAARLLFCGVQHSVMTGLSRKERLLKHAAVIWSRVTMDVMEGAPTTGNTRFIFPRCTSSTHSQKSMEMLLLSDQLLPSRQTALRADRKPLSKDQHVQQTRSWIKLPIGHSSLPLARL